MQSRELLSSDSSLTQHGLQVRTDALHRHSSNRLTGFTAAFTLHAISDDHAEGLNTLQSECMLDLAVKAFSFIF